MSYIKASRDQKFVYQLIDDFSGGMTNAFRDKDTRYARLIQNLDILSVKNRMGHMSGMAGETFDTGTAATTKICKYLSALNGSNTYIYGLGVVSSSDSSPKIFQKTSVAGSWTASPFGSGGSGNRNENLFVEYQGKIYMTSGNNIAQYTISGGGSFDPTYYALTFTNIYQGLVHSKDDILYIPYTTSAGAFILSKNGASAPSAALTLPTNILPVSICEYGNYLAIACKPAAGNGKSFMYLWDRNASIATLSEKADWGYESLELIEEIEGYIIGVSTLAVAGANNLDTKIIFKAYVGGVVGTKKLLEIPISSLTINFAGNEKQKINNRIYFMMSCSMANAFGTSTQRDGVWSFGQQPDGTWALSLDRTLNNDTAITSPVPKGAYFYGDWLHVAYTDGGSYVANRNPNSGPYASNTGIYESIIYNDGDSDLVKKLIGITVMFEPLPANSTIVLSYKADSDAAWTQIFSYNTLNGISHGATVIESSGVTLPQYQEIQWQIKVTGTSSQVAITGFKWKSQIIDNRLY